MTGNPGDVGSASGNTGTTTITRGGAGPGGRPAGDAAPVGPPAAAPIVGVDLVGQPGVEGRVSTGEPPPQIPRGGMVR